MMREDCLTDSGPNFTTNTLYQGNNIYNMVGTCSLQCRPVVGVNGRAFT